MSGELYAHEILGIPPRASAQEIRQAYKRLARQYHPDRNPSDEAANMFKAVKAAHDAMLEALENGSPSASPSFSQSHASARRTTSRGVPRTERTETGSRWRGPGSGEPGPAYARTGSGRPRARATSWQSDPRVVIVDPPDLDDLTSTLDARDFYRSSIWIVAMGIWLVMFFGFLLTLKAWQRPAIADNEEIPAYEGAAFDTEDEVEAEQPASGRSRY